MDKELIKGLFIGLVAPIVAYVIYVAFYLEAHVISLSVLINLLIFFMNLKTNRELEAKGILLATFIYAFIILGLKLS